MANAPPALLGTWKIAPTDRADLERTLAAARKAEDEDAVRELVPAMALWKRLELQIEPMEIVGDLGDGLDSRRYAVKDQWTSGEGMLIVDLELLGPGGPRPVSVMFTAPNKVMFQGQDLRLPLQRA